MYILFFVYFQFLWDACLRQKKKGPGTREMADKRYPGRPFFYSVPQLFFFLHFMYDENDERQ